MRACPRSCCRCHRCVPPRLLPSVKRRPLLLARRQRVVLPCWMQVQLCSLPSCLCRLLWRRQQPASGAGRAGRAAARPRPCTAHLHPPLLRIPSHPFLCSRRQQRLAQRARCCARRARAARWQRSLQARCGRQRGRRLLLLCSKPLPLRCWRPRRCCCARRQGRAASETLAGLGHRAEQSKQAAGPHPGSSGRRRGGLRRCTPHPRHQQRCSAAPAVPAVPAAPAEPVPWASGRRQRRGRRGQPGVCTAGGPAAAEEGRRAGRGGLGGQRGHHFQADLHRLRHQQGVQPCRGRVCKQGGCNAGCRQAIPLPHAWSAAAE